MKLIVGMLFLIGLTGISACNSYQRIDYTKPSKEILDLTNARLAENAAARKRILFQAVKEYMQKSSFVDNEGKVTENSIIDFEFLFESGAYVYNDLQLDPEETKLEYEQYTELVRNFMSRKGVIVEYDSFDINSFYRGGEEQYKPRIDDSVTDDDVFFYTYPLEKRIYNILNKNNQVLYYDEPMIYPLEITFRISINNQSAKIVSILLEKNKISQ